MAKRQYTAEWKFSKLSSPTSFSLLTTTKSSNFSKNAVLTLCTINMKSLAKLRKILLNTRTRITIRLLDQLMLLSLLSQKMARLLLDLLKN
jgi:hypothetical protein